MKWIPLSPPAYVESARANLAGADLQDMNLQGIDMADGFMPYAKLQGADLSRAVLLDCFAQHVDLRGATLQSVLARGADLSNADLREAELALADFGGARLVRADLRGASLDSTELQGADLTGAILTPDQLDQIRACVGHWSAAAVALYGRYLPTLRHTRPFEPLSSKGKQA